MKKLLTIATVFGLSSAAMAADFPMRYAPIPQPRPTNIDSYFHSPVPFYLGINAGTAINSSNYLLGLNAGVQFNNNVAGEVSYTYSHNFNTSHLVTANILLQTNIGQFTPYVLGGVGYTWSGRNEAVWNIGAGTKVALTQNIDFDFRYRYVSGFDTKRSANLVTGGFIFRF